MGRKKVSFYFKIILALLIIALTGSTLQVEAKEPLNFKDVKTNHPTAKAIEWAWHNGIVKGYEDGTFRPNAYLTEAQFAAMLSRFYSQLNEETLKYANLDEKIWSNSIYEGLANFQVPLLGYHDGTYRNKPVMRGLIAQVISYINGHSYELESAIKYLFDEKVTVGQYPNTTTLLDKYGYKNNLTRAQAVTFFHRLHQQEKNKVDEEVIDLRNILSSEKAKNKAVIKVDTRVKPIDLKLDGGYVKGQVLPIKPTYINGILIANKNNPLPKTYAPGENKEARTAFNKMAAEAKKTGITLTAFSTYRSFDYQTTLYNKYVKRDGKIAADRYSARPGYSEHQTGLTFDIGEANHGKYWASPSFAETKAGKWVASNSHQFGFIMRYPIGKDHITGFMHESWHFRYVNKEIAENIYKRKITLEEYVGI